VTVGSTTTTQPTDKAEQEEDREATATAAGKAGPSPQQKPVVQVSKATRSARIKYKTQKTGKLNIVR
jgi:hypothetical protein